MQSVKSNLISQRKKIDLTLLSLTVILIIFGLVMVYDASVIQALKDFNDGYYYIRQQMIWVVLGFASLFFFSQFSYTHFRKFSLFLLLGSLVLLVGVFIPGLGISGGGAHRWLRIGPITIQPAEIIKLTGIIFLAHLFEKKIRTFPFISLVMVVTIITAVLQKDLGSTIVFVGVATLIYFAAGGPLWHFLISIPPVFIALVALITTSSYRSKRVLAFLDPFSDTQGYTYHISQVLIALGSGGLFGLGLGQSRQKFEYIPEVTTDSIFGIIGEELGFLGAAILIGLYILLLVRGFKIAQNCNDRFGKILALGLVSWLGLQVIINLSSMSALLPLTGVPLPFISYGGSALLVNLTAVGILLNISKHSN